MGGSASVASFNRAQINENVLKLQQDPPSEAPRWLNSITGLLKQNMGGDEATLREAVGNAIAALETVSAALKGAEDAEDVAALALFEHTVFGRAAFGHSGAAEKAPPAACASVWCKGLWPLAPHKRWGHPLTRWLDDWMAECLSGCLAVLPSLGPSAVGRAVGEATGVLERKRRDFQRLPEGKGYFLATSRGGLLTR